MYVDYGKMEYGECKISNKKVIEGNALNTDCLVKSLKFEQIDWRNGWHVQKLVSDGNLVMIKMANWKLTETEGNTKLEFVTIRNLPLP